MGTLRLDPENFSLPGTEDRNRPVIDLKLPSFAERDVREWS